MVNSIPTTWGIVVSTREQKRNMELAWLTLFNKLRRSYIGTYIRCHINA